MAEISDTFIFFLGMIGGAFLAGGMMAVRVDNARDKQHKAEHKLLRVKYTMRILHGVDIDELPDPDELDKV